MSFIFYLRELILTSPLGVFLLKDEYQKRLYELRKSIWFETIYCHSDHRESYKEKVPVEIYRILSDIELLFVESKGGFGAYDLIISYNGGYFVLSIANVISPVIKMSLTEKMIEDYILEKVQLSFYKQLEMKVMASLFFKIDKMPKNQSDLLFRVFYELDLKTLATYCKQNRNVR